MDLSKINYNIQKPGFEKELMNFQTLRKISEIPDHEKVIKNNKHREIFKHLCQAAWESNGDMKITNEAFGKLFGISSRQASRIINKFEKLGLIACLRVRGFNGGVRYNKYGDFEHKSLSRKRYWTVRAIRIHWVLSRCSYVILEKLGWKHDFRPVADPEGVKSIAMGKPVSSQIYKYAVLLTSAKKAWRASRERIPASHKVKSTSIRLNRRTGEYFTVEPLMASKTQMISDGWVWTTFFEDMERELSFRSVQGAEYRDDPDVQFALRKYGYPVKFRRKRLIAILKRESSQV